MVLRAVAGGIDGSVDAGTAESGALASEDELDGWVGALDAAAADSLGTSTFEVCASATGAAEDTVGGATAGEVGEDVGGDAAGADGSVGCVETGNAMRVLAATATFREYVRLS